MRWARAVIAAGALTGLAACGSAAAGGAGHQAAASASHPAERAAASASAGVPLCAAARTVDRVVASPSASRFRELLPRGITIRDAAWAGDEPNHGNVKRLLRELLRMAQPPLLSVKVEADQGDWNAIFGETAGFRIEGREYSQRKWRQIWNWTPADDTVDRQRMASQRAVGRPPVGRPVAPRR